MSQDASGHTEAPPQLPTVRVELSPEQIVEKLGTAARRGKLAGFDRHGPGLFTVEAFGNPFDHQLIGIGEQVDGGTTVRFENKMLLKMPVLFAVVLITTVWPGVYFLDQLIPGEWNWIPTWWWYVPMAALPLPWVWRSLMKRSREAAHTSALEMIEKVAQALQTTAKAATGSTTAPTEASATASTTK